jgi:hypothetical protein
MSGTAYSQVAYWERVVLIALYNTLDRDNWNGGVPMKLLRVLRVY